MTKKNELISLIRKQGIRMSWLAEKLDIRLNTLHYLIYENDTIDEELYENIKKAIDSYQYEFDFVTEIPEEEQDLFLEPDDLDIGKRVRLFAKKKYGTNTRLAEAMEISPQQLHQYISGQREPGSKILTKLLRLGCDINWLLGGYEKRESYKVIRLENEIKNLRATLGKIRQLTTGKQEDDNE